MFGTEIYQRFLQCFVASVNDDDNYTPASEERGIERVNENVPPLNLPPETARQKTSEVGTDTSRSTLQE